MDCTVPEYITEHLEEIFQLMSSGKKKVSLIHHKYPTVREKTTRRAV